MTRYVEDNWKWCEDLQKKRIKMDNFVADKGQNNDHWAQDNNYGNNNKGRRKQKGRQQLSKSGEMLKKTKYLMQLDDLGFEEKISESVLESCELNFERAVDKLLQMGRSTAYNMHTYTHTHTHVYFRGGC